MEEKFIQGVISSLAISFLYFVYNSKSYTKSQKVILYIIGIFLPLSVLLALVFYFYNTSDYFKSKETKKLNNIDGSKDALEDLLNKELINENEFKEKIEILNKEKLETILIKDSSYINLQNLYNSKILTKDEFDQKVNLLRISLSKKSDKNQSPNLQQDENIQTTVNQTNETIILVVIVAIVIYLLVFVFN